MLLNNVIPLLPPNLNLNFEATTSLTQGAVLKIDCEAWLLLV